LLTISFAFLILYSWRKHEGGRNPLINESQKKDQMNIPVYLFYDDLSQKMMLYIWSTIKMLTNPLPINLGAITTQWVEHYFGHLVRLSNGDTTLEGIHQCAKKAAVMKIISIELKREASNPKRLKDRVAGATLPLETEDETEAITFLNSLIIARDYYRFIYPDISLPKFLRSEARILEYFEDILKYAPEHDDFRNGTPASMRGCGMITSKSLRPRILTSEQSQIRK
jgi:hypothetical protein